jgi:PEP-CTERM motif
MTHRIISTLGISAAAVVLLMGSPTQAQVVEVGTEIGNGADTRLDNDGPILGSGFADDVNGDFFALAVRDNFQGPFTIRLRAGLIRLDLSGVTEDFNTLVSAGLKVHNPDQRRKISVYGLVDGDAGESWDEATTSWNLAPGLTPNPAPYADITSLTGLVDTGRWTLLGSWEPGGTKSDGFSNTLFTTSYLSTDNPAGWIPAFPDGTGLPEDPVGEAVFADDYGAVDPTLNTNLASFIQADTDQQVSLLFFPRDDATDGNVSFLTKEHDGVTGESALFPVVTTPTLVLEFGTALAGDLDGDGFVGIADLNIVLGAWNQNIPPADPAADPSGDNFVGIADLNVVLGNWNAGTPPANSAVPEPTTLALLGLGGLAVFSRRSRA